MERQTHQCYAGWVGIVLIAFVLAYSVGCTQKRVEVDYNHLARKLVSTPPVHLRGHERKVGSATVTPGTTTLDVAPPDPDFSLRVLLLFGQDG